MNTIASLRQAFPSQVDKPTYIQRMYEEHHCRLFDYQELIRHTNVRSIEISADNIVVTTKDRGLKFAMVKLDRRIAPIAMLNFNDYEKDETNMIHRLIKDGDSVLDIGANIGWHSLNLAVSKRNTQIYAFEPIPSTFRCLLRNIELNSIENVQYYNFGFSDEPGEFNFYYYPEGSGNASLANLSRRDSVSQVTCNLSTVDTFVQENKLCVDFIKCDVEGAELLVFKGAKNTITKFKPIIFSEILRKWSKELGYNANDIFSFFYDIGYKSYTIEGAKLLPFEYMNEDTIATNFFFIHPHNDDALRLINLK